MLAVSLMVLQVLYLRLQSIFSVHLITSCLGEGKSLGRGGRLLVLATTGKWIFRVSRDVNWLNYWQCPWIHSQSSCSTLPNRSNTIGMLATFHHRDKILLINNIKIYLAHGLRYFSPQPFGHLVYACGKAEHHGQDSIIDLSCSLHGSQETEWAREERYRNKKKKNMLSVIHLL